MNNLLWLLCKLGIKHTWKQNRSFSVEDMYSFPYKAYKHLRRECPHCGTKQEWVRNAGFMYDSNQPMGEWVTVKEYTADITDEDAMFEELLSPDHKVEVDCGAIDCFYSAYPKTKRKKCATNIITLTKNGKCLDYDVFDEEDLKTLGVDPATIKEMTAAKDEKQAQK
jgi:hypothetical protein